MNKMVKIFSGTLEDLILLAAYTLCHFAQTRFGLLNIPLGVSHNLIDFSGAHANLTKLHRMTSPANKQSWVVLVFSSLDP